MDIQQEVDTVANELLELIAKHLEENKTDPDKAKELAQSFLAMLPVVDHQDLLDKLKELAKIYPEAQEVYVEKLDETQEVERQRVLIKMRNAISKGNIEHAITIAKDMQKGTQ